MRTRLSIVAILASILGATAWGAANGKLALPGYQFRFPRDHFSHPEFATEWWYYTGNLSDATGRPFGFELTFFRQALDIGSTGATSQTDIRAVSTWRPDQLYLAHFALSDLQGGHFFHAERLNRAGPGLAGASFDQSRYWNGNWQVLWQLPGPIQQLKAITPELTLQLELRPEKPPVVHGQSGVSQKAPEPGQASHYISFTRLGAEGTLLWKDQSFHLKGLAWMDHEFFSQQLDNRQAGWDWFCVQLENSEELMFYSFRKNNGPGDPYSSGTFVDAQGASHFLRGSDFTLQPGATWTSPSTGAAYPIAWTIRVPSLGLQLSAETPLKEQELNSKHGFGPTYWEGAVRYAGSRAGQPARGVGYLEMTGYDRALLLGQK
jgi:predicted secreted hydrolase